MIQLSDFITILIALGTIVGIYVNLRVKMATLEERISSFEKEININKNFLEKTLTTFEDKFNEIIKELKFINKKIIEIEKELENKVDR